MSSPVFVSFGASVAFAAGTGPVSLDKPAGVAQDDLMLLFWTLGYFGGSSSTLVPPSGWTILDTEPATSSLAGWAIYYKVAGASEPSTYSVEQTGNTVEADRAFIAAWTGNDPASPIDAVGTKYTEPSNTSTPTMQSVTAATGGSTLVAWDMEYTGATRTIAEPSGMTLRVQRTAPYCYAIADLALVSAGATGNKSFNQGTAAPAFTYGFVIKGLPDTTAPDITSTGTGSTNGPFSANLAENSTAAFITLTANENVTWSALGGADAALFQKANVTATTVELQPIASFNFESLPHANPFVITITGTDGGGNPRTVTVNASVTNVLEPPTISVQPANQTTSQPATATFSVTGNTTAGLTLSYQWQRQPQAGGGYSNIGGATSSSYTTPATTVTGGTANNGDTYRCILTNADGNVTSNAATLTVNASDSTNPVISGNIGVTALTTTSYTLTWPAATDNVAVTGYEYSLNGGSTYVDAGNVLTIGISGRGIGSTDSVRIRAYDAAGNKSNALAVTVNLLPTTLLTEPLENTDGDPLLNILVHYSWYPNGRIGQLTGITPLEGTGQTNPISGRLLLTTLPPGPGILLTNAFGGSRAQDTVHYQPYTVA